MSHGVARTLLPVLVLAQALAIVVADRGTLGANAFAGMAGACVLLAMAVPGVWRVAMAVVGLAGASALPLAQRLEAAAHAHPDTFESRTIEGRVSRRDARPGFVRLGLEAVVAADRGEPVPTGVRLQGRDEEPLRSVLPGTWVRARVVLETAADARNPGARDERRTLARTGVGALARLVDPLLLATRASDLGAEGAAAEALPTAVTHALGVRGTAQRVVPALDLISQLRVRVGARLSEAGPGGAILRALACGDRVDLPERTRRAFQELGLVHLLSVSGLHLVLVAGLGYGLAAALLRRVPVVAAARDVRRVALAGAVAWAAFYALFAGFEVPVQRSLVAVAGAGIALARRRPLRVASALAAAASLVLAANPATLFDAGAQMSFAASAALLALRRDVALGDGTPPYGERLRRLVRELLSTSAAATAATAPLAATHLGVVAPAGLVANLFFVPFTGVLLLPASLIAAALASIGSDAAPLRWGLVGCAWIGAWSCRSVEAVARLTPDLPPTGAPPGVVLWICLPLALVAVRGPTLGLRLGAAAGSCALLLLAPASSITPGPPRVVFLDVGQGDATLVQGVSGNVLVDAALALPDGLDLGRTLVVPALAALGVRSLDLLVVTHGDADHRGGVPAVLEALPVRRLWLPHGAAAEPAFDTIRSVATRRGVAIHEAGVGSTPLHVGDLRVTPLWPPTPSGVMTRNDRSLVVRVDVGETRLLLPGDIEAAAEAALVGSGADLRSDVLKLPHHGSRTSSSPAFLAAVGATLALASAPCAGRFGMPDPEVVSRLEALGVSWRWTGREGALLVGLGRRLTVRAFPPAPLDCTPGRRRSA